ncbi:MAG: YqcC family protein [Parahaliea sp.]
MNTDLVSALIDVEARLRQLGLWEALPPPSEALASTEPFAVDTLTLPQWLQFIFLPRLYQLLEQKQPLPERCAIAPMAEEYLSGNNLAGDPLLVALRQIDELLTRY